MKEDQQYPSPQSFHLFNWKPSPGLPNSHIQSLSPPPEKKASYQFIIICLSLLYLRSKPLADRMSTLAIIPRNLLAVASLPNAPTLKSNYITGHENGQTLKEQRQILITWTWRHREWPITHPQSNIVTEGKPMLVGWDSHALLNGLATTGKSSLIINRACPRLRIAR